MTNRQQPKRSGMRPNIDISYQLNGRVKDFAAENDLRLVEAYTLVIETGLDELTESTGESGRGGE